MANPVLPSSGALSPLGLDAVRLAPGFWGDRVALNREVTIAHAHEWMEREGWIGNFRGELPRRGREFSDSEIYKLLEAMAWADHPDFAELALTVVKAQEGDGYLNTRWSGSRYTDFEWGHELYCYGHLIQAGVARLRTHGQDAFTEAVRKAADHVCRRFMDGTETCGHPELEMAMVELYRATGVERYLELARRLLERRGLPALGPIHLGAAYFQDDLPVRQATTLRGHAVRALYLACGAVDVAVETGDDQLLEAVRSQWERAVARRTHLTGGMGSRHADEGFGEDFELPPDRAYAETCAGIASIMLSHRLLLATGEVVYADLAERTLFNVLATGVALDGRSFFYSNPLQVRVPAEPSDGINLGHSGGLRSPWFAVSCCPSNIARTFASLGSYLAAADPSGLRIHHHTPAVIEGAGMRVAVETGYPWSGGVAVRMLADGRGRLSLRVPAWAEGATVGYGPAQAADLARREAPFPAGARDEAAARTRIVRDAAPGYAAVEGEWRAGDVVTLDLPMAPRWTFPDRRVDALRGTAAVERGPLVYCAESVADEPPLAGLSARLTPPVEHAGPSGVVELEVEALLGEEESAGWPYSSLPARPATTGTSLRLVPYHRWGNAGPATMRVWLPTAG
ncbi:glycoside hydrolase family 127 protein [Nonomuraea recticatena]|uniref:Glycoside hydrolase family 127 protein n=1 Tax=Nonomuraea recticatena TaxID=46178 RepID=A0ABP6EAQ1_9ACTN